MARTSNSNRGRSGSNNSSGRRQESKNNNPTGKNQYSSGFGDYARERPMAAAAAAAAAVGAGVFLWSRRGQISEQISTLSDQLQEWNENRSQSETGDYDSDEGETFIAKPKRGRKSQTEIAEEAMTLKSTGSSNSRPMDETAQSQTKAGAVAY